MRVNRETRILTTVVLLGVFGIGFITSTFIYAQGRRPAGPPPGMAPRAHMVRQSSGHMDLVPATRRPAAANTVSITVKGDDRVIRANGIPDHMTGRFPNKGNPNKIKPQEYVFKIPVRPKGADRITPLGMHDFGIAVNGVPFDPGAAEWYLGDRAGGWQYEALSGAVPLGLDESHAHVQPTGAYHYHSVPTLLLTGMGFDASSHSPLVGWAADGFPIYGMYGYRDSDDPKSGIKVLRSSYRLKSGRRPSRRGDPGGTYDGTFVADYQYVEGLADLDECNGRMTITPEFPDGTYAYFLTESWPVIPRCYKGTPSRDFMRRPRPRPPRPRFRPPPPR